MGAEETDQNSSETNSFSLTRMIDLSVAIVPDAPHEPFRAILRRHHIDAHAVLPQGIRGGGTDGGDPATVQRRPQGWCVPQA